MMKDSVAGGVVTAKVRDSRATCSTIRDERFVTYVCNVSEERFDRHECIWRSERFKGLVCYASTKRFEGPRRSRVLRKIR